ncbi:hypothetical protein GOBAR_AA09136 [Gossypium barbadense]|uniref:Uncharacterized protein n=1 Tax=Gossypium barbadense TaxID=3634 RepID=A0A2P5Y7F6_GOSBA|nr:hypothetical protein GOBAR_AA09136 [Gossypium barbadense]
MIKIKTVSLMHLRLCLTVLVVSTILLLFSDRDLVSPHPYRPDATENSLTVHICHSMQSLKASSIDSVPPLQQGHNVVLQIHL